MGVSTTVIAFPSGDFPKVAQEFNLRHTGELAGTSIPPIALMEGDDFTLLWIDDKQRNWRDRIDFGRLSANMNAWVLVTEGTSDTSALSRYQNGTETCLMWASQGMGTPLEVTGDCPFDIDALHEQNEDRANETSQRTGGDIQAEDSAIPFDAFEQVTRVQFGAGFEAPKEIVEFDLPTYRPQSSDE